MRRFEKQIDGNHYEQFLIQPVEFSHKNCLSFITGNIVKYACRWEVRNQIQDLDKIIHYAEILKTYTKEEMEQEETNILIKDIKDEELYPV